MRKNVTFGVLIILVGVVWLLSNLNLFTFSIIGTFFHSLRVLWPILLIGIGLSILLKENSFIKLLIWLLIFFAILLYGVFGLNYGLGNYSYDYRLPGYISSGYTESSDFSLSRQPETERGLLDMNLGFGKIELSSTEENLFQYTSNIPKLRYNYKFEDSNKKAVINLDQQKQAFELKGSNQFCTLQLDKNITWEMDLNLGAADTNLDFSDLAVTKLDLNVGAANLDLSLGDNTPGGDINIKSGATNLIIWVPEDAGLKIKLESALSANNVSQLGLINKDGYYQTPDFDDKACRYVFTVKMGVGNLEFKVR